MIPTAQALVHQLIEQTVHIGDVVVDATTANGINTRFLATRVGTTGHVISYTATKDNANAAATSLFMSGLSERVTLLGKNIDSSYVTELGQKNQASIAIFDYSSDAQNNNDFSENYLEQIDRVLPRLTHGGLLIIKFNNTPISWQTYTRNLIRDDFKQATYITETVQAHIIERI